MQIRGVLVAVLIALWSTACSGPDVAWSSTDDLGEPDAGSTKKRDARAVEVCTDLSDRSPIVGVSENNAGVSGPAGGTITDGTYEIAALVHYAGSNVYRSSIDSEGFTIRFSNGFAETANRRRNDYRKDRVRTSGRFITFDPVCGNNWSQTLRRVLRYTATEDEYVEFLSEGDGGGLNYIRYFKRVSD